MERKEAIEVIKRNYPHVTESGNQFETALRLLIPELKESEDELTWLKRFIKEEIDCLSFDIRDSEDRVKLKNLQRSIAWLEKQGNLMKALQISNAKIGELIEKNYYLKEQLEKQGEHANFLSKIQVGDKVTRNEDGVLVNISQLNRVAKKRKNQGNNMGISEATKKKLEDNLNKALEKETPESWNKFLDEQGEQKSKNESTDTCDSLIIKSKEFPASEKLDFGYFSESTDKVEPKFHEGEWLVQNERKNIVKVVNATPLVYKVVDILGYHHTITNTAIENNYHLWTIQDAKNGDVLSYRNGQWIFIFKEIENNKSIIKYFALLSERGLEIKDAASTSLISAILPATKEQRDLLFQKIKDAGYEWDAEKKELKKIEEKKDIHNKLTAFEFSLKHIIEEAIECNDIHNLKADADLLLRIARKTSWSEEDERMYRGLHNLIYSTPYCDSRKELSDWFKSLKERYAWKPSDGQMDALNDVISSRDIKYDVLSELWKDLKKLK